MTGSIALTLRFFRETAHRCDLDNLVKSVCDALQRVVFEDDSQVVLLLAEKSIDRDRPRVEILVEAVHGLFHNGKLSRGKAAMLVIKQAARIEADEVMRIKAANVENENEN